MENEEDVSVEKWEFVTSQLREEYERPQTICYWVDSLRIFDLSMLDAAVLWSVTQGSLKYGFYSRPQNVLAVQFNVSELTVANCFDKLCKKSKSGHFPLIKRVKPTKEARLEYFKENKISFKTKNEENGYLKAKCYRATNFWVSYITPDLGKGEKETKA